jgi:hypothetical protein
VICIRENERLESKLKKLMDENKVIILLDKRSDGTISANAGSVCTLVNFLVDVRRRALMWSQALYANYRGVDAKQS